MYQRRFLACVLGGIIAAAVCLAGRQVLFGNPEITWEAVAYTIANRLLLAFVIAVSGWSINRYAHGAILGLIVSFSVSLGFLFADPVRCLAYTAAGVLYGVMIEWLSSDVFKAPLRTA